MGLEKKQESAKRILRDLYSHGFVETIYNAKDEEHREQGWTLKNGSWSPWYMNIRPLGDAPTVAYEIAHAMNDMLRTEIPNLSQIIGVEMAGVPLVGAIGTAAPYIFIRYAYTRPLPGEKVRTPEQAAKVLSELRNVHGYGGKELVEGRFKDGEVLCIVDDMVTDFGSKLITKLIVESELKRRGVRDVSIDHVAVVLDREQGAAEEAKKHRMHLHSLINFKTDGLNWLEDIMRSEEHQLLTDFQKNPSKYQDKELQRQVLKEAKRLRQ